MPDSSQLMNRFVGRELTISTEELLSKESKKTLQSHQGQLYLMSMYITEFFIRKARGLSLDSKEFFLYPEESPLQFQSSIQMKGVFTSPRGTGERSLSLDKFPPEATELMKSINGLNKYIEKYPPFCQVVLNYSKATISYNASYKDFLSTKIIDCTKEEYDNYLLAFPLGQEFLIHLMKEYEYTFSDRAHSAIFRSSEALDPPVAF